MQLRRRSLPLRLAAPGDPAWQEGGLLAPAHRAQAGVTLLLPDYPVSASLIVRIAAVATPRRGVAGVALDPPLPTAPVPSDLLAVLGAFLAGLSGPVPPETLTAINQLLAGAQELLLRLAVMLDGTEVESWDEAAFDPAHPNFLPRLLGRRSASELLLAPPVSGGDEPDRVWGDEDDPPGSEFLRPSLALLTTTLTPTAELLAAPLGLQFDAATLLPPATGSDANLTTGRTDFFKADAGRSGGCRDRLESLRRSSGAAGRAGSLGRRQCDQPGRAGLHARSVAAGFAELPQPDAAIVDDTVCFGPCQQAACGHGARGAALSAAGI